jgi:hypothetical protein
MKNGSESMTRKIKVDQEKIDATMSLKKFDSETEIVEIDLGEYLIKLTGREMLKMKGFHLLGSDLDERQRD